MGESYAVQAQGTLAALRAYLVGYPRRHWDSGRNRRILPLAFAFLALALYARYRLGASPYCVPPGSAWRLAAQILGCCVLPFAVPLLLVRLCGGFRRVPDRAFWFLCALVTGALAANQYAGCLADAFMRGAGVPGAAPLIDWAQRTFSAPLADFLVRNAYDLRAIACYLGAPALYWLAVPAERRRPFYGLTRRGFVGSAYAVILLLALPLLVLAARQPDFVAHYPRYQPGLTLAAHLPPAWPSVLAYELLYCAQFVALEVFFRGFIVMALEAYVGSASVAVMLCAYCVLHFVKPMPEALSSIAGGYLLGVIALYTRSVYGGIAVHVGIALTLEALSFLR